MDHRTLKVGALLITMLGGGTASASFAQDAARAANSDASATGDIIVTARRSEERLQDVPISITVLSQDAITKRNIVSGTDLANYVPSLSTNQNFGPEKASFAIRGFTQEGKTSPSVGVYFADVVAPRSNGGTTSGNGAGVGAFMDLQNVQVLKGPQGTLFGRNTTGGAILLVPTKPTDRLGGYVEGSIGDYDMHRVQAALNVPVNDTFRVRGAVDWNQRDGYLHNRSGVGPSRLANTNYVAARVSVVADLTPDLENYVIASYSRSNTRGVAPRILGCNRNPLFPITANSPPPLAAVLQPFACGQVDRQNARGDGLYDVETPDPNPREQVTQWQVINTTTWRASDTLTIKNIASYAEYREKADFNLFGDYFLSSGQPLNFGPFGIFVAPNVPLQLPTTPGQVIPGVILHPGVSGYNSAQSTFTEELQFQGTTKDRRLNWQVGAYLEISKPLGFSTGLTSIFNSCTNIYAYQCTNPLLIGSVSAANTADTFNNKGFYGQATYKLTDKLSLTGGIRYTIDHQSSDSRNVNVNIPVPGTPIFSCQNVVKFSTGAGFSNPKFVEGPISLGCDNVIRIKSRRPTWLIDVDYKPTDDILIYAKWARGYRQGGINSNNLGLETWGPEKVDTYETGLKTSFRGAVSGYFNLAAFYNKFSNQQLAANSVVAIQYQGSVPNAQPIINAGKSRIYGLEADASITPVTGLRFDVAYAYLNTKLQSITVPTPPVYYSALLPSSAPGDPLAASPRNRVTVTGTYTLPLDPSVGRVSVGATFTHTDANRALAPLFAPNYLIPTSNLLNLNADWNSVFGQPFDLSFFMTNATNKKLITYPTSAYLSDGQYGGYPGVPRMFGFRVRYRFGD